MHKTSFMQSLYAAGGLGPKLERKFLTETKIPASGKRGIKAASIDKIARSNGCQFATNQLIIACIKSPF